MSYLKGFFEGPESKPSIRLVCGLLVVLLSCWLELRMVRHSNIEGLIQANFIFVSSLFAITAARLSVQSFAARPPAAPAIDKSTTNIRAENAPIAAETVNLNTPAE